MFLGEPVLSSFAFTSIVVSDDSNIRVNQVLTLFLQ